MLVLLKSMRIVFCLLMVVASGIATDNNTSDNQLESWPNLSANRAIALRTQRDVSGNATVASAVVMGVNLTSVVFEPFGYNDNSLADIRTLLNVGVEAMTIDAYYNEYTEDWTLCPYDILASNSSTGKCGDVASFNISSIVTTMNEFLSATDTVLSTNVLYILLNLNSIVYPNASSMTGIHRLGKVFQGIENLVTPEVFNVESQPTLHELLFTKDLRVFTIVVEDNLLSNTTYDISLDLDTLFVSSEIASNINKTQVEASGQTLVPLPAVYQNFNEGNISSLDDSNSSSFRFLYETEDNEYIIDSFRNTLLSGYSPIISRSFPNLANISSFLENSFWSWAAGQPPVQSAASPSSSGNSTVANQASVYRCAILTDHGWTTAACSSKFRCACLNPSDSDRFVITKDASDYMSAEETCYELGDEYVFALPHTAMEQRDMMDMLPEGLTGVWININSISSGNCWVEGLITACPYQKTISRRIFIRMITPGSVVAFLLLCLIAVFQFDRVPVQKNRKHWRKLMHDQLGDEFEGVPS
ncbi:DEKNAAC105006 [Brettanomyces naardenensis]|uniref:Maintenance of telomere capping protein 6 n=1 Tax=Brettanomyces naardenensis TaxID=13370 RepID=A0A448YSJ1_BRENA|nr:DEKNAAC105006 [Brettanomyces naardenensis]